MSLAPECYCWRRIRGAWRGARDERGARAEVPVYFPPPPLHPGSPPPHHPHIDSAGDPRC